MKNEFKNVDTVIFDLDGTLTDSAPGVMAGVIYAAEKLGYPVPPEDVLRSFVGPPMIPMNMQVFGIDEAEALHMLNTYREYYLPKGLYENSVFPGIVEMIGRLKAAGFTVTVGTAKPEPMAKEVLRFTGLESIIDFVRGVPLEEGNSTKAEVLTNLMKAVGGKGYVMVGDTKYDMKGAGEVGIPAIGVEWGYGSNEELLEYGACALAATPADVCRLLGAVDE